MAADIFISGFLLLKYGGKLSIDGLSLVFLKKNKAN
jgi:hypothetical protein